MTEPGAVFLNGKVIGSIPSGIASPNRILERGFGRDGKPVGVPGHSGRRNGVGALVRAARHRLTEVDLAILDFCWGFICDEEMTPESAEICAAAKVEPGRLRSRLENLQRRRYVDLKDIDGELTVWRVRLPDGRNANMDLIERG